MVISLIGEAARGEGPASSPPPAHRLLPVAPTPPGLRPPPPPRGRGQCVAIAGGIGLSVFREMTVTPPEA
ncbi:hypothetical protein FGW20_09060 [Methanoculleus sp. FWC-SCC3]|uniref:Uncharacterized protein n=1 Tax=Methanoculleus methanifontis TaxID=2584086 RepID=A0ABT8M2B9_9EURY|nr:hypothetical protein [Methanoculleus sp. FWC-SCC3]